MFTTFKMIVQSLGVQDFIAFNTMLGSFVHDWTFQVANIIVGGATLTTRDLVDDVIKRKDSDPYSLDEYIGSSTFETDG
jgi:hypothetical protein